MQAAAPDQYHVRQRQGHNIAYYMKNGNHNNMQMKIALPRNVIPPTFTSYHSIIGQSGSRSQTPSSAVDYCEYNLGGICQQEKLLGPGYGLRPECELLHTEQVELNALTCVDTTTNLVELTRPDNKEMTQLRDKFTQAWLCRYPLQRGSTGALTFNRDVRQHPADHRLASYHHEPRTIRQ
eukprot:scaffold2173_cov66-Skeletonema_dohrnii-CCMP3373.AAC.2